MTIALIILTVALICAITYIVVLQGRNARLDEHIKAAGSAEERFAELAARTLATNAESLRRQSTHSLTEVLAPMKDNLESFRRTIADTYTREARERFALGDKVRELIDLNRAIGSETRRLTNALKGNTRFQGDWGETILNNILSSAGLREGYEYRLQESITDSDGRRLRPDVLLTYSPGRTIVILSLIHI